MLILQPIVVNKHISYVQIGQHQHTHFKLKQLFALCFTRLEAEEL